MDVTIETVARFFAQLTDEQIDMVIALQQRSDEPDCVGSLEMLAIAGAVKANRTAVPQPRKPGRPRGSKNRKDTNNDAQ